MNEEGKMITDVKIDRRPSKKVIYYDEDGKIIIDGNMMNATNIISNHFKYTSKKAFLAFDYSIGVPLNLFSKE